MEGDITGLAQLWGCPDDQESLKCRNAHLVLVAHSEMQQVLHILRRFGRIATLRSRLWLPIYLRGHTLAMPSEAGFMSPQSNTLLPRLTQFGCGVQAASAAREGFASVGAKMLYLNHGGQ